MSRIDAELKQQKEKSNLNGKLTEQFLKGWHVKIKHMKKSVREMYTKTTTGYNFSLFRMYMFKTTKWNC